MHTHTYTNAHTPGCCTDENQGPDPRYTLCAVCRTKHVRKNWGVPHRVTEELAAQFWQQRGVRVHTGGWVCTDAFETVRTPLARARGAGAAASAQPHV